jgi:hypothetical protein
MIFIFTLDAISAVKEVFVEIEAVEGKNLIRLS